ncbi:MAG: MCE family protein [Fibrobacter sp.]|nr:MCE family protein [Fibrobacter sp.]
MYELQKKFKLSSLRISIVITLALVILFMAIFFAGNIRDLFTSQFRLFAFLPDVQGLRNGAPVWLYGVEIGKVQNIEINDRGALISVSINKKLQDIIKKDATMQIMTMGILGDKFVKIFPGLHSSISVNSGDTLRGKSSISFEELTSNAFTTMLSLDTAINKLSYLIVQINKNEGSISKLINEPELYNNLVSASDKLNYLINQITTSDGSFKKFLKDTTLYLTVSEMVDKFSTVATVLDQGLENGSIASTLMNDTTITNDLKTIFNNIRSATNTLDDLIEDIKVNPRKYFKLELF